MPTFNIGFEYTAHGKIDIEAADEDEAYKLAEERLDELKDSGTLATGAREVTAISWDRDEVEVD